MRAWDENSRTIYWKYISHIASVIFEHMGVSYVISIYFSRNEVTGVNVEPGVLPPPQLPDDRAKYNIEATCAIVNSRLTPTRLVVKFSLEGLLDDVPTPILRIGYK